MSVKLTTQQKHNLLKKAKSGDYYVWLSEWKPGKGQHIVVFPTNKGLSRGMGVFRNFYPVLTPRDSPPSNKRGGNAYKEGRFFTIKNSLARVLDYNFNKN